MVASGIRSTFSSRSRAIASAGGHSSGEISEDGWSYVIRTRSSATCSTIKRKGTWRPARRSCLVSSKIRVAAKVLDGRERERVHPFLDRGEAGGRELSDTTRERFHEIIECGGGQRAVDPAVAFGEVCVEILRAQHDLERPRASP
jgi:hypothetical protein